MLPFNLHEHFRTAISPASSLIERLLPRTGSGDIVDRRSAPRRIYMHDGYLTFPHWPAYPATICLIRDLSRAGARIELTDPIPDEMFADEIRLFIVLRDHERQCRISWREGDLLGLSFWAPSCARHEITGTRHNEARRQR